MAGADNQETGNGLYLTHRAHTLNSGGREFKTLLQWRTSCQRIQLALLIKVILGHARCQGSFGVIKPPDCLVSIVVGSIKIKPGACETKNE